jgi:very-short-patch-repair endonuclease
MAFAKEKIRSQIGNGEIEMLQFLVQRGLKCIPQKAIGPYNVDIAIAEPPIAVEIYFGNWHRTGPSARRFPKRVKYIFSKGWYLIVVWINVSCPISAGAADYIFALAEKLRRGESPGGQYKMISGNGSLVTI